MLGWCRHSARHASFLLSSANTLPMGSSFTATLSPAYSPARHQHKHMSQTDLWQHLLAGSADVAQLKYQAVLLPGYPHLPPRRLLSAALGRAAATPAAIAPQHAYGLLIVL